MARIEISDAGPIHKRRKWDKTGNKCSEYNPIWTFIGWENNITYSVVVSSGQWANGLAVEVDIWQQNYISGLRDDCGSVQITVREVFPLLNPGAKKPKKRGVYVLSDPHSFEGLRKDKCANNGHRGSLFCIVDSKVNLRARVTTATSGDKPVTKKDEVKRGLPYLGLNMLTAIDKNGEIIEGVGGERYEDEFEAGAPLSDWVEHRYRARVTHCGLAQKAVQDNLDIPCGVPWGHVIEEEENRRSSAQAWFQEPGEALPVFSQPTPDGSQLWVPPTTPLQPLGAWIDAPAERQTSCDNGCGRD